MGMRQGLSPLGWILLLAMFPLVCPLHGCLHLAAQKGAGGMETTETARSLQGRVVGAGRGHFGGAQRQRMRLRGGGDMMVDEGFAGEGWMVGDGWNLLTDEDMFGVNVTMMTMTRHPYITVELWWDSMGKFRCSYDDMGEDILCIFSEGGISDRSAWELNNLAKLLDKERGLHPLPRRTTVLGAWTLEHSERFVRVRNLHQEQNYLYLTEYGFVFADAVGNVVVCKDNSKPRAISREAAGELLGLDTRSWPVQPELTQEEIDLWDVLKGPVHVRDPFEPFPDTSSIEERGAAPTHPDYSAMLESEENGEAEGDASAQSSNAPDRVSDASVRSSNAPARASEGAGEGNRATPNKRDREE